MMDNKKARLVLSICTAGEVSAGVLLLLMLLGTEVNQVAAIILAAILIGALVTEAAIRSCINRQLCAEQRNASIRSVAATVAKRRTTHCFIAHTAKLINSSGRDAWFVTFESAQGETIEYEVPYDVYESAREGMTGVLRYKGAAFVSFKQR